MITDALGTFGLNLALNTGAAAGYLIGDVIDLQALGGDAQVAASVGDIGSGRPTYLVIQVSTTATSGGSATASFSLASDAVAAIVPGTATIHATSGVFAVADMVEGKLIFIIALPQGQIYERYLGIVQTTAVAAFTAGAVDAFLTFDASNWRAYPDGQN